MSEPFIAEVRIFAGNFAPRSWAFCNGQLLPISQNTALFSLIGTTYGGDGRSTTALPDLQGRFPMHPGRGPGLTARRLGQRGGVDTVTLTETQMPNHQHTLRGDGGAAADPSPGGHYIAGGSANFNTTANGTALDDSALPNQGGSQAHNNLSPYLEINYIIALQGLFPSRS